MQLIDEELERPDGEQDLWATEALVKEATVKEWHKVHDKLDPRDLHKSLEMIHVQAKGPRIMDGEELDEGGRIMVKFCPTRLMAPLWDHVIVIWKKEVERRGGYISNRQPTQPKVRNMMDKANTGRGGRR